jgi:GMP synthase (glutamine-hydrolysing)
MMCRWIVKAAERMSDPGARPGHEHLSDWRLHDAPVARWSDAFLGRGVEGASVGAGEELVAAE